MKDMKMSDESIFIQVYEVMLKDFNEMELKILINTFGFSTIGSRDKLETLAIDLLRNSSYRLCRNAYISNISELHNKNYGGGPIQHEVPVGGPLIRHN